MKEIWVYNRMKWKCEIWKWVRIDENNLNDHEIEWGIVNIDMNNEWKIKDIVMNDSI